MTGQASRRVKATVVVTAAVAALTASQAPGPAAHALAVRSRPPVPPGWDVSGSSPYRTVLPPLRVRGSERRAGDGTNGAGGPLAAGGGELPVTVLAAYRGAERSLSRSAPGCRLRWQLLASIGQVESGQARGGRVAADGTTLTPILGPRLDGNGFAVIRDTDGGTYDGDTVYDRAVGPMQFIPSTWAVWGADGNGDGRSDPGNIHDAALAAGRYLCADGRDLSDAADLDRAILGYNHSTAYLRTVRAWFAYFLGGHRVVPDHGLGLAGGRAPEPPRTPRPAPAPPARGGGRAAESPAPAPSPAPASSPTPAPSPSEGAAPGPGAPPLPVPEPVAEPSGVPVTGLLPGGAALTSDG